MDIESLFITLNSKQLVRKDTLMIEANCFNYITSYDLIFNLNCTPKRAMPGLPLEIRLTNRYLAIADNIEIRFTMTFKNENESPRIDGMAKLTIE